MSCLTRPQVPRVLHVEKDVDDESRVKYHPGSLALDEAWVLVHRPVKL
jgi:hypothetical protein